MGLWDTLKEHAGAQFLDVLEWADDTRDSVVYRFPIFQKAIQDGAKLVVREGQTAVFVSEGKLSDVFAAGTHDISTRNAPIMGFFESIKYGLNMPYKGDVYFVNTRVFADHKWGTPNPIPIRDADLGVVRMRGFGSFAFRVSEPATFLREVVGTTGLLTTEDITGQLKRKLVSALADTIGEAKIPLLDLVAHYMDFGDALRDRLNPWFKENYGITLTDFVVENISVPPEVEKMMDKRSSMALAGDMNTYMQFQAANAMEEAAKNPDGGGGFMQAGLGLAMGQTMAAQLGQAGRPAAAPPPLPPPLPAPALFHHAGPDGVRSQLAPADVVARVKAQPGRHLVWKEGMAAWEEAAAVPEIAALLRAEPPPLPPG